MLFNVEAYLRKFWLAICSEVLIPEATGKLEVSWQATSHQNLFVLLWALW